MLSVPGEDWWSVRHSIGVVGLACCGAETRSVEGCWWCLVALEPKATINFCMNPTSWRKGAPVTGGMADCLAQPVLAHLATSHTFDNVPHPHSVNVYYSHRKKYSAPRPPGEIAIFASHGIADKAWRNANRVSEQWDYLFVSGPTWSLRYAEDRRINMATVIEVGYPKLDPVFNHEIATPVRDGRIRVVWAPTHGGGGEVAAGSPGRPNQKSSRFSSHHHRAEVLALLPESEFDVVTALHPRHRADGRSTLAEYVGADVVIADGGSTIYEAWALDLPVVFPSWLTANAFLGTHMRQRTMEADIYRRGVGWHANDPDELARTVADAAQFGITDAEVEFIEPIFPRRYRGVSGRMHAEALDDIAARVAPRHQAKLATRKWMRPGGWQQIECVRGGRQDLRFERNPRFEEVLT